MGAVGRWQAELARRGVPHFELSVPSRRDFLPGGDEVAAMDTFWRVASQGGAALRDRRTRLGAALDRGGLLRVQDGRGGVLEVELEAREPGEGSRVISSLPAGGVARLVRRDGATGSLRCAYTLLPGGHHLEPQVSLADGELVALDVGEGSDEVAERIDAESGPVRRLAYVTIGASPVGGGPTGKPSLDSVLEGVVTLAFGSDRALGGEADATLDLRFTLAGATVELAGRTLVRDGRLALDRGSCGGTSDPTHG